MKKLLFFLLISVMMCEGVMAGSVSRKKAQEFAREFAVEKQLPSSTMELAMREPRIDNPDEDYFTVYNLGQEQGFVIISGEDSAPQVLGYSTSGRFDPQNMPDNMRAWLKGYADQIDWLVKHPEAAGPTSEANRRIRRAGVMSVIAPLLETKWNQGDPYNQKCPMFLNTGTRCVTGCVATAMAQVLYYHAETRKTGKPNKTTAEIPAYKCSTNWSGFGQISVSAIPANTTIDWTNMAKEYNGKESDEAKNAVAELMQYCGASVNMNYRNSANSGSSSSTSYVPAAFKTYFGYDAATRFVSRSNYDIAGWRNLIYNELAEGRPVLYGGQSSGGGHAFVVDGFDGELFHVNWGWGGSQDSYFVLSVLNPYDKSGIGAGSGEDGYSYGQDAVIGAQPDTGKPFDEEKQMTFQNLTVSGTTITCNCWNLNQETLTFDYGFGFIDNEGNIDVISSINNRTYEYTYGPKSLSSTIDGNSKSAGTYKIVPISKLSSSDKWLSAWNAEVKYIEAVFDGSGNVTLTLHPVTDIEGAISFEGNKFKGEKLTINVEVNNKADEFYGVLYMFASTTSTKGKAQSYSGVTVPKNSKKTVSFSYTPTTSGTYNIWVATDEEGTNVIANTTVAITDDTTPQQTGIFIYSNVTITNANEDSWTTDSEGNRIVDVYSNILEFKPRVLNNSKTNYSNVTLNFGYQKKNGDNWETAETPNWWTGNINAGSYLNFTPMNFGKVGYGTYRLVLKMGETITDTHYIVNLKEGYLYPTYKDGVKTMVLTSSSDISVVEDAQAIDLRGVDFTSITPNSNPNTLYILPSDATVPAALSGKNIVKGDQAGTITIEDGKDFFSPIEFTSETAIYKRTFSLAASETGGWSTIILPFDVSSVEAAGMGAIDWFKSGTDSGKNFWLKEFSADTPSNVQFTYSTTMKANTPYIIAVPGNTWGDAWKLTDKEITFKGSNVTFKNKSNGAVSASHYKFDGTTIKKEVSGYNLDAAGSKFNNGTVTLQPFRAYFTAISGSNIAASLGIIGDDDTTGISILNNDPETQGKPAYNLQGQQVDKNYRGIVIKNGKKVMNK